MRRRIYEALTNPKPDDRVGRAISYSLLFLIAANVIASILETDAAIAERAPLFFEWFEKISVAIFTAEYLLRVWSSTERLKEIGRPMSLLDLAAIAPSYLEFFLPNLIDLRFLRVLRLLRLFRLTRASGLAEAFAMLSRVIQAKRTELGVSLSIVGIATMLSAGAIFAVERTLPNTQFTSIPRAMWWSVETITTVGYGDMTPQSALGKIIGSIVAFLGICTFALPVGIISSGFISELDKKKTPDTCPHCGERLTKD